MIHSVMHPVFFVIGVSGSGKTTTGKRLSQKTELPFFDADDFHSASNIDKMKAGIPLTDEDRNDWLQQLNTLAKQQQQKKGAIIACSALKEIYRQQLAKDIEQIYWIYLKGDYELIHQRMEQRPHHYFSASMLQSQFDTLEEPANAFTVTIHQSTDAIVETIVHHFFMRSSFGIIGLGIMGKSLALNFAGKGHSLSLYNRFVAGKEEKVAEQFIASHKALHTAKGFEQIESFVASLAPPRKILLMVNAGKPTDDVLAELKQYLSPGDIVIDGGNAHYKDTERRMNELAANKIHFIGAGISGGEEGALNGASVMVGGDTRAYEIIKPFLEQIAAKDIHGNPCCIYVANGSAGHFVKMVHNAIEYAEMQLISEVYDLLRNGMQQTPDEIATVLETWNKTKLNSYLLEITVDILRTKENADWLVDKILDVASGKGTGSWALQAAAELGTPAGMLSAALFARYLSAEKSIRVQAADLFSPPGKKVQLNMEDLASVYHVARIVNHHQGFQLIQCAAKTYNWQINYSELTRIWTNGCIIRSALMQDLVSVLNETSNMLLHSSIVATVQQNKIPLTTIVTQSLQAGFPIPSLSEALNYINAAATKESAMNIIQAQRDYFGAHTYQRNDDATGKLYHTEWKKKE
jgi:6-phosphogluconate dehydrogenase